MNADYPARIDSDQVVQTVSQLSQRIKERFPDASLIHVCDEILKLGEQAQQRAEWIAKPNLVLRAGLVASILIIGVLMVVALQQLQLTHRQLDVLVVATLIDTGKNNVLLLAGVIFFLFTIELRIKRQRLLKSLHELRGIAHLIDMHQLTKDPDRLLFPEGATQSSPVNQMGIYEMSRYLDYCCEMLSLIGKITIVYGLHWQDPVAARSINDVDNLTMRISQKIFQKIMILHGTQRLQSSIGQ